MSSDVFWKSPPWRHLNAMPQVNCSTRLVHWQQNSCHHRLSVSELHLKSPATGEWPSRSFKVIENGTNLYFLLLPSCRSQWPNDQRVRLRCDRTKVRISTRAAVFIATAAAIGLHVSLGHRLRIFSAVLRSTQRSALREAVKWVSAYGLGDNNNGDGGCGW